MYILTSLLLKKNTNKQYTSQEALNITTKQRKQKSNEILFNAKTEMFDKSASESVGETRDTAVESTHWNRHLKR